MKVVRKCLSVNPRVLKFATYAVVGGLGTLVQYVVLVVLVKTVGMSATPASTVGMGAGAIVNYLLNCAVVFRGHKNHWETGPKFAMVACCALGVNAMLMHVLCETLALHYLLAQVLASGAVLVLSYLLNSVMTFKNVHHGSL